MRIGQRICGLKAAAIGLAAAGLLIPAAPTMAAPPDVIPTVAVEASTVRDVELSAGSVFRGQLVDPTGAPVAGASVILQQDGREVAVAKTEAHGFFAVVGLRGGTYVVTAAGNSRVYRLWAPRTAPPTAQQAALLVSGDGLARGQLDGAVTTGEVIGAGAVGVAGFGIYELAKHHSGS